MNKLSINFIGDIALIDGYSKIVDEKINPFCNIIDHENDLLIGNLESFISSKEFNYRKKPRLPSNKKNFRLLKDLKLDIACLANNHANDFLAQGVRKTIDFLDENKIQHLGCIDDNNRGNKRLVIDQKGIKIGILNFVDEDTNPGLCDKDIIHLNLLEEIEVVKEIKSLKPIVDHLVLILHWGGRVEGGLFPEPKQQEMGRLFIDNGADLIIGHHSHTLQPFEIYNDKLIFYSLGNFCFSDYTFEGKLYPLPKRRRVSSILNVEFTKTKYYFSIDTYTNLLTHYEKTNKKLYLFLINFCFKHLYSKKIISFFYIKYLKRVLPVILFIFSDRITIKYKFRRILGAINKRLNK